MVNMLPWLQSEGAVAPQVPKGGPTWNPAAASCPSQGDEALDGGFNHDPGAEWLGEEGISATH